MLEEQDLERLEETIQKLLLAGDFNKAKNILSQKEKLWFIKSYLSVDNATYYEIINREMEMANEFLQIELKKKSSPPYDPNFVELLISIAFLQQMDRIVEVYKKFHIKFRESIKDSKFNDPKNLMFYQFNLGLVIAQANTIIQPVLLQFCQQFQLDENEFKKQALMFISADVMRFLEIDKYVDLQLSLDEDKTISKEQVYSYISKALQYMKEFIETPLNYESTIIISNLIYQYLYKEFGFTNQKFLKGVNLYIESDYYLQEVCLEYVYYQETIRNHIMNALQHHQQVMNDLLEKQQNLPEDQIQENEMPQMDEQELSQMMEAVSQMDMDQLIQNMNPEMVEMMREMYKEHNPSI